MTITPRIVVVGGGLAGLSAAVECADRGAEVTLLESRSRLGGATWSRHHRRLGFEIDNGQHVFMRCCEAYRGFLNRIGVADRVFMQQRLSVPVWRPGESAFEIRRHALPAPAHLLPSLLSFRGLSLSERFHAAQVAARLSRLDPEDARLDDASLGDWLGARGSSANEIERLWDLLIRPTLNLPVREASLALAVKVMRTGFLDRADGADIGWSRVPLTELHGEAAAKALAMRGGRVHLRAEVDRIESSRSDGVVVHSRGQALMADAVILATPPDVACKLVPESASTERAALAKLETSPIVSLHIVLDRKVMDVPLGVALGSELEWIFDRSERLGNPSDQYLTVALSAAERWLGRSVRELEAISVAELHRVLPRARAARVVGFAATVERHATFRASPGTRALRPGAGTRIGRLYLAGAFTQTGWPATMEGAVRSGLAAARSAVAVETQPPNRRSRIS